MQSIQKWNGQVYQTMMCIFAPIWQQANPVLVALESPLLFWHPPVPPIRAPAESAEGGVVLIFHIIFSFYLVLKASIWRLPLFLSILPLLVRGCLLHTNQIAIPQVFTKNLTQCPLATTGSLFLIFSVFWNKSRLTRNWSLLFALKKDGGRFLYLNHSSLCKTQSMLVRQKYQNNSYWN